MTQSAARRLDDHYTYGDYAQWSDDARWELIDGAPFCMSPAPNDAHQSISGDLFAAIYNRLEGKPCRVFAAPFDLLLPDGDEPDAKVKNVFQPDLLVVCDRKKRTGRAVRGAPDLVVEILSPSTSMMDFVRKKDIYERHGVPEYWIVDPESEEVAVLTLGEGGRWNPPVVHRPGARIVSKSVPAIEIEWKGVPPL